MEKKAGQLYEAQKIRSKISSEEQMVQKLKADIGNVIFEKYKEGAEVEEALKGFCEEIEQHLDIIDGYKDAAAEMKGRKICPACGKSVRQEVSPFVHTVALYARLRNQRKLRAMWWTLRLQNL